MINNYSVIGLGKLGASMAAAIASRGFNVIGVDVNQRAVDAVNAGHTPVQETGLEELIAANKQRLRATLNHPEAVLNSDVSFVIVPTPSDERGAFSLQYAAWAFREMGKALAQKQSYHLIVLTSTVLPGSTRYGLLPILERASGKKCGADFGLCYSPEFIALGSVIRDFLNPDFNLVGEFDARSGGLLEECYAHIMANQPPCMRMSIENAELTKISVNTYVTTKITFANMLADLCERIPGGDIDVVTNALGFDRRIGHPYLKGGLGYGGPCFPRDNVALGFIARELGMRAGLAEITDQTNRALPATIVKRLQTIIPKGATIAVLGLAYKPFSHVIEESQGMMLAKLLADTGARVIAYDPLAAEGAKTDLAYHALVLDSLKECLAEADCVLITTPDPAFKSLKAADFGSKPVTVVDFWRILDKELTGKPNIRYIPFGRSTDDQASKSRLKELWGDKVPPDC
jgi:UDPglucose 6-dehydrogenase